MSLLSFGFRPFFLLTAGYAVVALFYWGGVIANIAVPWPSMGHHWHAGEMVFGWASGLVAGFLLTAVGNWTGRRVTTAGWLGLLAVLWLGGRLASWPTLDPNLPAAIIDGAFLPLLAITIAAPIVQTRSWRNLFAPALVLLWASVHMAYHAFLLTDQAGLALAAAGSGAWLLGTLLVIVTGRIVPFFTALKLGKTLTPRPRLGRGIALLAWLPPLLLAFAPAWANAVLLLALAAALLLRQSEWAPLRAAGEPMLAVLHAGHLLLALAYLAAGLAQAGLALPATFDLHLLTTGALGLLGIGMMARVTLGHTGRPIESDNAVLIAFLLVGIGAAARLASLFWPDPLLIGGAAWLWGAGFAVFLLRFAVPLATPRPDAG